MFKSRSFTPLFFYVMCCTLLYSRGEVVNLDDSTFEHQTQASTGMTTGSWFVLFKATGCSHCKKILPIYEELSNDEDVLERGIILASSNVKDSPVTSTRFGVRGFPTLIFLHKKRLYRYTGKRDYESMKTFIMSDFQNIESENIPHPPSTLEYFTKVISEICQELYASATGKYGKAGYAIIVMLTMLTSIFVGILSIFFLPAKKDKIN